MANSIVITGRLTKDPELRHTKDNIAVVSIRIACDRYIGKGKEKKTDFFGVEAWRGTAEFVAEHFTKGKLIEITGSLQTAPWEDKNGSKHEGVTIVAEKVAFAPTEKKVESDTQSNDEAIASPPVVGKSISAAPAKQHTDADIDAAFANYGGGASSFSEVFAGSGADNFSSVFSGDDLPF